MTEAVRRILDDARYTERVRAISKRLQAEDAVNVACGELEKLAACSVCGHKRFAAR
jgi:UDP:flavonoid glycosyltransferase YjiC (YdhE family)